VKSPAVRALLSFQAGRAREYFAKAARSLPDAERRAVLAAEIMRAIYEETLRRIEDEGFDVFSRVIRIRRVTQARIAAGVLWDTTVGRSH
jgi:phytoene synthase